MPKSTTSKNPGKPAKPRPDFPLWPHPSGRWCRKIKGRAFYFGKVADDPKGERALEKWNEEKDDLLAGRTPRKAGDTRLTMMGVCNRFLTFKKAGLNAGELSQRSFDVLDETCARLLDFFGKHRAAADLVATDFEQLRAWLAKGRGPVWLANEIQRTRCVFRYCYESGLLDVPVRFGPGFRKPSAKVLRANRQKSGPRMFQPAEIRSALDHATINAKAMLLLGINAGFGNTDIALLPVGALDLDRGILDFPRSKTATPRVVPLWPETVDALRNVLAHRPAPADKADADKVFIRVRSRDNYVGDRKGTRINGEIRRALAKAKITGRTFYDCRRTFQTIAEGARAVQAIMGHAAAAGDMSAVYRQGVALDRKRAVVNHVHDWLFGTKGKR